jgi:metal-responsive CopG/Arc/MetJ family transcriptional regulator
MDKEKIYKIKIPPELIEEINEISQYLKYSKVEDFILEATIEALRYHYEMISTINKEFEKRPSYLG